MNTTDVLNKIVFEEIREKLDRSRIGVNIIQLKDGELPIFKKDPESTSYIIGEDGDNILTVQKSKRLFVPLMEIATEDLKISDFSSVKELIDYGLNEIIKQEKLCFDALREFIKNDIEIFLCKRTDVCCVPFNSNDKKSDENIDKIVMFEMVAIVADEKNKLVFDNSQIELINNLQL